MSYAIVNGSTECAYHLGIGSMQAFLPAASRQGYILTPSVVFISDAHKAALDGLSATDLRRQAAAAAVYMGDLAHGRYAPAYVDALATVAKPADLQNYTAIAAYRSDRERI